MPTTTRQDKPLPSHAEAGRYEVHFTEAGPVAGLLATEPDHGPDCGVEAFPIGAPVLRIMVLPGPWSPIV
jgi:hypothetical protein